MRISIWSINPKGEAGPLVMTSAPATLDDASKLLPGGAYTTFRTYHGTRVIQLPIHFARLEETARLAGKSIHLPGDTLSRTIREVMQQFAAEESRIRLIVDLEVLPGTVFVVRERLQLLPKEVYSNGVAAVTVRLIRTNPRAKLTAFMDVAGKIRSNLSQNVYEGLLVGDDGLIREGLSSNFFGISKGELWTAEEGVLEGTTRSMVLEIASKAGIPVRRESLHVRNLPEINECFITSVSRGILPVIEVDKLIIGNHIPGPITRQLMYRYDRLVDELAVEI